MQSNHELSIFSKKRLNLKKIIFQKYIFSTWGSGTSHLSRPSWHGMIPTLVGEWHIIAKRWFPFFSRLFKNRLLFFVFRLRFFQRFVSWISADNRIFFFFLRSSNISGKSLIANGPIVFLQNDFINANSEIFQFGTTTHWYEEVVAKIARGFAIQIDACNV